MADMKLEKKQRNRKHIFTHAGRLESSIRQVSASRIQQPHKHTTISLSLSFALTHTHTTHTPTQAADSSYAGLRQMTSVSTFQQ